MYVFFVTVTVIVVCTWGGEKKQQHPADYDSTYFLMIDIYDRLIYMIELMQSRAEHIIAFAALIYTNNLKVCVLQNKNERQPASQPLGLFHHSTSRFFNF
jgi:hypothetical protein